VACHRAKAPDEIKALSEPYPMGTWRLDREAVQDVVLTVSHVLILYGENRPEFSAIRAPGWRAEPDVHRERPAALRIAAEVARKASADPASFPQLARTYSEDLASRDFGGSLGTWSVALMPPPFIDALATMKPGEVSRIIETEMGLHILMLRDTPKAQTIAASEIVIAYESTSGSRRPGHLDRRTRDEAAALAKQVAQRAQQAPDAFPELVERYSDEMDALRRGDIGVWDSHDAFLFNREAEVIAGLKAGEVSAPVDSAIGFRIFKRELANARPNITITTLSFPYGQSRPRADAERLAEESRQRVLKSPEELEPLQRKYCCTEPQTFPQGRGPVLLELAAERLAVGEIGQPIEFEDGIHVIKRLEPAPIEPPAPKTQVIPRPSQINLDRLVRNAANTQGLAADIRRFATSVDEIKAPCQDDQRRRARELFEQFAVDVENSDAAARDDALKRFRGELRTTLPPEALAELRSGVEKKMVELIAPELAAQMR
jgi:parvulin-like peptidyl-prolyl isomerase